MRKQTSKAIQQLLPAYAQLTLELCRIYQKAAACVSLRDGEIVFINEVLKALASCSMHTCTANLEKGTLTSAARQYYEPDMVTWALPSLQKLNSSLRWWQNPEYVATMGRDFLDSYSSSSLVSPLGQALLHNERIKIGLIVLGPDLHYASHHHPAAEIYYILSGTSEWCRGREGWKRRSPGDIIVHVPNEKHAFQTLSEPIVALWAWTGDIATNAKMSRL